MRGHRAAHESGNHLPLTTSQGGACSFPPSCRRSKWPTRIYPTRESQLLHLYQINTERYGTLQLKTWHHGEKRTLNMTDLCCAGCSWHEPCLDHRDPLPGSEVRCNSALCQRRWTCLQHVCRSDTYMLTTAVISAWGVDFGNMLSWDHFREV